jgi:hypothetical protein
VLGALAIVIAVLLVLQYRDRQEQAPDVTETQTPAPTSAPATPGNWTPNPRIGQSGQNGYFPLGATALPGALAHDENYQ